MLRYVSALIVAMIVLFGQQVFAADKVLEITATQNVYAHIYRDFPVIDEDVEEIVLQGRILSIDNTGAYWGPSIILYWSATEYLALSQQFSGEYLIRQPGRGGLRRDIGIPGDVWVDCRIVLRSDTVEFWMKGDGDWVHLHTADRHRSIQTLPKEIIVGKAYRPSTSQADHLDGSATPDARAHTGFPGSSYVDYVSLSINGKEVIREEFDTLDDWKVHFDPKYTDEISIGTIDKRKVRPNWAEMAWEMFNYRTGESHAHNPTSGWAPRFQKTFELPERARIPIVVDWDDNQLDQSPVTFGVPLPRGLIESPTQLRLVADGCLCEPIPAQMEVTATWDGPDGPARWVLISTTLEKNRQYALEYGRAVRSPSFDGIQVEETDTGIIVNTGSLRAEVSKQRPTVLDSVALDLDGDGVFSQDEMMVTPELAMQHLPIVVDGRGREYVATADEDFKVEIVRSGPMEMAIRREGWYIGEDGTRFSQFITYTYFYHGQSGIRHDHTLVTAFDSTKHQIRDIRLSLPLNVDETAQAMFAQDTSASGNLLSVSNDTFPVSLVQTHHNSWRLTSGGQQIADGDRAGGWFGLGDRRWGAFAGWRDFWQQYPAELEVADGILHMHLWPSQGVDPLDFTPSVILGDDYPGDQIFWQRFYEGGLDSWTQAYGLGKTHNIWIDFHKEKDRDRSAEMIHSFTNNPVLAMTSPEWNASTEVMGRIHPEDRENFPEIEAILDAIMHRKDWLQERLENYGWINYGDVNYRLSNPLNPDRVSFVHWRRWASMYYGWPNVSPLLYMRSGRRDAWNWHRINTRHITDIDVAHLTHERFGKAKGGRYGGNSQVVHYAANIQGPHPDNGSFTFMLYDYYINGNLRTKEVAHDYMEHYADVVHNHYSHRVTGGALRLFAEAYEATWNPKYLDLARHYADLLLQGLQVTEQFSDIGYIRHDDVYVNVGRIKYYQVTGEEWMRDFFLNDMRVLTEKRDYHVHEDIRHTTMWGLAHAYWFTGDERFLDFLLWQLEIALGPDPTGVRHFIPTSGDPAFIGATGQTLEYAYHATLGNQLPAVIQLLVDLDLPLPYLLSNPRTILRPDKPGSNVSQGDAPEPMVIYAPDGFMPPPSHEALRVYFRVGEENVNPGIHFNTAVRLFDPTGALANGGAAVSGWFDLPTDQPGLWSFEPVSTIPRYQVRVRNVAPFFALQDPRRYFESDVPWVEWQSPLPEDVVRGDLPIAIDVQSLGDKTKIKSVQIFLQDQLLYAGGDLPQDLVLNSLDLEDGSYQLRIDLEIDGINRSVGSNINIVVHNRWDFRDDLRAPIGGQSAFGGFFGSETLDLSLTSDKSTGWQYATDRRADFLGDSSRMVRINDTTEYLVWDLPERGLNSYVVTIYARESAMAMIGDAVDLGVRSDERSQWQSLPFEVEVEDVSNAGWHKMIVSGAINSLPTAGQLRLLLEGGHIDAQSLQIGQVHFAGYRLTND